MASLVNLVYDSLQPSQRSLSGRSAVAQRSLSGRSAVAQRSLSGRSAVAVFTKKAARRRGLWTSLALLQWAAGRVR